MMLRVARNTTIGFVLLTALAVTVWHGHQRWSGEAFSAFYCAGEVVAEHRDPYLVEPLRGCEHRVAPKLWFPSDVAEPAPLPGYALVPFALLSHLPYGLAAVVMVVFSFFCVALAAALVAEVAGIPFAASFAAFVIVDGIIDTGFGETPQIAIASLALCGALLVAKRERLAAVAAALVTVEPHLGLPVCLSLLIWVPRARLTLVACGAVAAVLSLVATGVPETVEYLTKALPLQSAAEITAPDQYSLTWFAHVLGAGDKAALGIGWFSYLVVAVLGIGCARRIARLSGNPAFLAFFPAAATLFLGIFIHDIEMPAALPAALAFAGIRPVSGVRWLPVLILAIPWQDWYANREFHAFGIVAVATIAWSAWSVAPARRALNAGIAIAGYVALVAALHVLPVAHQLGPIPGPWPAAASVAADDYAPRVWGASIRSLDERGSSVRAIAEKTIVWTALLIVLLEGVSGFGLTGREVTPTPWPASRLLKGPPKSFAR